MDSIKETFSVKDDSPSEKKDVIDSIIERSPNTSVIESIKESIGIEEGSPEEAKKEDSSPEKEGCIFDLDAVKEAVGLIDTPEEAVDKNEKKDQPSNK